MFRFGQRGRYLAIYAPMRIEKNVFVIVELNRIRGAIGALLGPLSCSIIDN